MVARLRPQLSNEVRSDVVWNLASFVVMGAAGIALNVLVASLYDSSALGVFNQVYTIYILLSQVAVAGIHLSALKHSAVQRQEADSILVGALVATTLVAVPVAILGYLGAGLAGDALASPGVAQGIRAAAPGVALFALNKVLLALHNGLGRLKAFAVFQSLRFVLMIAALLALAAAGVPPGRLAMLFTLAEAALLVALLVYTVRGHALRISPESRTWAREHFRFGRRAMVGNLLADVNTRVDILLLGLFTADAVVGIYSFAALIAEGFSQLSVVFRNVVNPKLAKYHAEHPTNELEGKLRQGIAMTYRYTVPCGLALTAAYPLVVRVLGVGSEFQAGWLVFALLMAGITASMGYSAFQQILNQGGFPGRQSAFYALSFVTNVVLNLALIPVLGMVGSALATGISFVLSIVYLRVLVRRAMGVRM